MDYPERLNPNCKKEEPWVNETDCAPRDEQHMGLKEVTSKPTLELIPPDVLWAIGEIFEYGAKKYGRHNWERGIEMEYLVGSLLRHLTRMRMGEELDNESHLRHSAHMACVACMILWNDLNSSEGP
jgi:hypothetical protein